MGYTPNDTPSLHDFSDTLTGDAGVGCEQQQEW